MRGTAAALPGPAAPYYLYQVQLGLAAGDVSKTLLRLAGINDVWSKSFGQTQSTINNAFASFEALKQTTQMKISPEQGETVQLAKGKVE
jgi:small subunit ribosomal protein S5